MGAEEPTLSVRLLGTFEVWRAGAKIEPDDWGQRKTEALFKFLVLHRDRVVTSDQLLEALYPDSDPAKVRKNLSGRISQLRQALEPDLMRGPDSRYVKTVKEGYRFTLGDDGWIDVDAFESELQEAESLKRAERWGEALARYREALDLYGGDLLPEETYEEWTLEPRERLMDRHRQALEGSAVCHIRLEQYPQAIERLKTLLDDDPTRESAARWLMLAHHFNGTPEKVREAYETCAEALAAQLEADPSPDTRELLERIQRGKVAPPERPVPHNLPQAISQFVGREREIAELREVIQAERLVTLTGTGGSGKTRLALEVAFGLLDEFPDGAWFVDLAPVADPDLVPTAVLSALGLDESPNRPATEVLTDHVGSARALILLDNCEHLVQACADLADRLLETCPNLTVLATSREGLGLVGSVRWRVPPLALPDGDADCEHTQECDAVRLFVTRARSHRADFRLTEANAEAVRRICRRLDGLPLAIELAAARLEALSAPEIAERLDDRFRLLTRGDRAGVPRQQTLKATLEWSYDLLRPKERTLFRRLSVFAGSFSLEAVQAVAMPEDADKTDTLELIAGLVRKSLLQRVSGSRETRYRLLETIRQFADRELQADSDVDEIRARHLAYFLGLAEAAKNRILDSDQATWLDRVERDYANVRAALRWALDQEGAKDDGLRLIQALWRFWMRRNHWIADAERWLKLAIARTEGDRTRARARVLMSASWIGIHQGDVETAVVRLRDEAIPILREIEAEGDLSTAINDLGVAYLHQGNVDEAEAHFQEALKLREKLGAKAAVASSLNNLGVIASKRGEPDRAWDYYERACAMNQEVGHKLDESANWHNMGQIAERRGDLRTAQSCHEKGVALAREIGGRAGMSGHLGNLALVLADRGKTRQARACSDEAVELTEEVGVPIRLMRERITLGMVATLEGDLAFARDVFLDVLSMEEAGVSARYLPRALVGIAQWSWAQEPTEFQTERVVTLLGKVAQLRETVETDTGGLVATWHESLLAELRKTLSNDAFSTAFRVGREMSLPEAADAARAVLDGSEMGSGIERVSAQTSGAIT